MVNSQRVTEIPEHLPVKHNHRPRQKQLMTGFSSLQLNLFAIRALVDFNGS
jgi:hypothetical protein